MVKQSATLWTFNNIAGLINEDKKNPVNKAYSISFKRVQIEPFSRFISIQTCLQAQKIVATYFSISQ